MELDVFHLDRFPSVCWQGTTGNELRNPIRPDSSLLTSASVLEHDLVVQTQTQFGHSRQVTFHLYGSQNLAPNDVSAGVDLDVGTVQYVVGSHPDPAVHYSPRG